MESFKYVHTEPVSKILIEHIVVFHPPIQFCRATSTVLIVTLVVIREGS